MKKSIFVIAALFAATFVNAQITLEKEFEGGYVYSPGFVGGSSYITILGDIFMSYVYDYDTETRLIDVYDANSFELITSLNMNDIQITAIARNLFTTDNSIIVLGAFYDRDPADPNQTYHINLYRADGTVLQDLGYSASYFYVNIWQLKNGDYRLWLQTTDENNKKKNQVYSLPGKGQATEISSPSSPKRSARKIANKGNVLVETENNTYTLTGQQVK